MLDYFSDGFYKCDTKLAKSAVRTRRYARRRSAITEVKEKNLWLQSYSPLSNIKLSMF